MIELQHVNKYYSQGNRVFHALRDINLTVEKGEIFGVIGRSGAGKSSLLRCINFLERPNEGEIKIAGVALAALNKKSLRLMRRKIGMIFQHFNLLSSRTVAENIALPLELIHTRREIIKARVSELLSLVELSDRAEHYPHELSGGQKQRVAIARALATHPELLLCDEATSSLDPESTLSILQLLKKINQTLNLTIVIITHEMDVVKNVCHRVAVMDQGQIVEQAPVITIFAEPKSPVTQRLTQANLKLDLPSTFQEKLQPTAFPGSHPIVRLAFIGQQANEPLLANLMAHYSVKANIFEADLEIIQDALVGVSVCQLMGEESSLQAALAYIKQQGIKIEIIGYV